MPTELLLDTHVWYRTVAGEGERLSAFARRENEWAAAEGRLRVSPISAWEIGMLVEKGLLVLTIPALEWVRRALLHPGVEVLPLSPETAVFSASLQGGCTATPRTACSRLPRSSRPPPS